MCIQSVDGLPDIIFYFCPSSKGAEQCGGQSGQLECQPPNPCTQGHTKHVHGDYRDCKWKAQSGMGLRGKSGTAGIGAQMSTSHEAHTVTLCVRAKSRERRRTVM